MKRFLAVFLMLAILLTGLTVTANAATAGWKKDGDVWTYVKADGTLAENEWIKDGGKWYYFIGTAMAQNEVFVDSKTEKFYAADATGAMISNLWFEEKETYGDVTYTYWYYAGANGELVSGWKQIDGVWYYFYGAQKADKNWWPSMMTGLRIADWTEAGPISWFDSGKFYAFKPTGQMIVGWGQPYKEGGWVYGNADGSLVTSSWKKIDGKWYYFSPMGWMYYDEIVPFVNGKPADWEDAAKATLYAFNKSGAMVENAWYKYDYIWQDEEGNEHPGYSWYYAGKDGALQKGWLKDGGKWYYLDSIYGFMYSDDMYLMSDGKWYGFKASGEMVTGWYQFNDIWYYFKADGARAEKEWVKSGNSWYYLKEGGQMAKDEILTIDGKPYKFDANGVWVP